MHNWVWGDGTAWDRDNWVEQEPADGNHYIMITGDGGCVSGDGSETADWVVCKLETGKTTAIASTASAVTATTTSSTSTETTISMHQQEQQQQQ